MPTLDDSKIVIENFAKEVIQLFQNDISDRDDFFHRGTVKIQKGIACNIRKNLTKMEEFTDLHADVESYQQSISYDDESICDLLVQIERLNSYESVANHTSQCLKFSEGGDFFTKLYLTLFSFELIRRFIKMGTINDSELKKLSVLFQNDIENKSLIIKTTIGMRGIFAVDDIVFTDPFNRIIIRRAKESDVPDTIFVNENGLGRLDNTNSPYLPDITTILEITHLRSIIYRQDLSFRYIKQWDFNTIIDLTIDSMVRETSKVIALLQLFQSKQRILTKTWKVSYHLKNLSDFPIYEKQVPFKRNFEIESEKYILRNKNSLAIERFFNWMRTVDFIERIHHYSNDPKFGFDHIERPLEIAYKRYLNILSNLKDPDECIHDTIEALEGFFTPEKPKTKKEFLKYRKIFITRIDSLIEVFGDLDPNSTTEILSMGFNVRSDMSHRGKGWDEVLKKHENTDEFENRSIQVQSNKLDNVSKKELSSILLSYLRICIVARILSGIEDRDFIDLLNSKKGLQHLESVPLGLSEILLADPPVLFIEKIN